MAANNSQGAAQAVGCVILIGLGLYVFWNCAPRSGGSSSGTSANQAPSETQEFKDDMAKTDALTMADVFVQRELKSPGSMKEPGIHDDGVTIENTGGDSWHVKAYVDSQNSFGALIRTYYDETLHKDPTKADNWILDNLQITGDSAR